MDAMKYQDIVKIVSQSASIEQENAIERKYQKSIDSVLFTVKPMKVITGLRRSGKSFILKLAYKKLIDSHIPPENILFVNFESDYLIDYLSVEQLRTIYETFYRYAQKDKPFYLFLDEIQNIKHWEQFIRTIYDSTNGNIFITGSNSHLLSAEFSTVLGGRLLQFEIRPFSFSEMLDYYHIEYHSSFTKARNESEIRRYFDTYLSYGGLPETFEIPDTLKLNYRQNLVEKIIINDILKRYEIQSTELLSRIIQYVEKNVGTTVSFNNIAHVANASEKTVAVYVQYLTQTFLIHSINKFSLKTKQIFDTQKKYYFIDNIFVHLADIEDRLENTVYVYLIEKYGSTHVAFGKDERGHEIDFVVSQEDGTILAFQVCYQLTEKNYKREARSLVAFKGKNKDRKITAFLLYMQDVRAKKTFSDEIEYSEIVDFLLSE